MKFILGVIVIFLSSCYSGSSEREQMQLLEKTVMQIHDEAMGKMEVAYQLRTNLQKLPKQGTGQAGKSSADAGIKEQIHSLEQAEEAMMAWMHQYRTPDKLPVPQAKVYLQNQLVKIKIVKSQLDQSLAEAQETHQQYVTN